MPYVPHTEAEVREMLAAIGVDSIEALFAAIKPTLRPKSFDLPPAKSEMAVTEHLERLAGRNAAGLVSFLGAGVYDHHIPSAVDAIVSRGEFATAYTPYQPEASQGTLQAIFEYQTAVTRLTGLPYANASVYDGGSALFEAMMMAVRATRRTRFVVSESVSPIYRIMLASYTSNLNLTFVTVAPLPAARPTSRRSRPPSTLKPPRSSSRTRTSSARSATSASSSPTPTGSRPWASSRSTRSCSRC